MCFCIEKNQLSVGFELLLIEASKRIRILCVHLELHDSDMIFPVSNITEKALIYTAVRILTHAA